MKQQDFYEDLMGAEYVDDSQVVDKYLSRHNGLSLDDDFGDEDEDYGDDFYEDDESLYEDNDEDYGDENADEPDVEDPKYEFTQIVHKVNGRTLHQIVALRDFADVRAGEIGGFIQSSSNLSHLGNAWVYDSGVVYGEAVVEGDAQIEGTVHGNAFIGGSAVIISTKNISSGTFCGAPVKPLETTATVTVLNVPERVILPLPPLDQLEQVSIFDALAV
jgi:hypothetical protein